MSSTRPDYYFNGRPVHNGFYLCYETEDFNWDDFVKEVDEYLFLTNPANKAAIETLCIRQGEVDFDVYDELIIWGAQKNVEKTIENFQMLEHQGVIGHIEGI